MTESNKFLPVDTLQLYGDSIGAVTLYDASHANESEAQRVWTVTQICSLAYGNEEAKNPEALYERMKSIKHESLFEFVRHGTKTGSDIFNSLRSYLVDPNDAYMYSNSEHIEQHKQNIACFKIKVPMFIRAQFMRHRSFSYLEISRRYTKGAKIPFQFWYPKDFNTCIGGKDTFETSIFNQALWAVIDAGYETQVASRFLPQTTYTEFYCMAEVEGLRNFMKLRLDSHAQKEIRAVAEAMLALLVQHQPELAKKVTP